jgi:hypothetical protein
MKNKKNKKDKKAQASKQSGTFIEVAWIKEDFEKIRPLIPQMIKFLK